MHFSATFPQPMVRRAAILAAALALAGCGVAASSAKTGSEAAAVERSDDARDVDLTISGLAADPAGPTTADTITLTVVVGNLGTACTRYTEVGGSLSYIPFRLIVMRDGVVVHAEDIHGLTGGDEVVRQVVLHNQPAGDKSYTVTIDSESDIDESDETNNEATVVVRYGGSG
jgi:subtilase family serine protease